MDYNFQKLFGASGIFLIVLALLNLFTGIGELKHIYLFMCLGLFLFFDSLNYYIADQRAILDKKISIVQGLLFFIFFGSVFGFVSEIYGGLLTGVWQGVVSTPDILFSIETANYALEIVLIYGVLVLPGYSIFRILRKVFQAETMLEDEYDSDYYKYFVHLGLLMLAAPFSLLFLDVGMKVDFLMFMTSLIGLLLVIEYFEFRKKGQGIIADLGYRDMQRLGGVLTVSIFSGFIASVLSHQIGFWSRGNVPFARYELFQTPVSMILAWTMIIWVLTSGFNLVLDTSLSNLSPSTDSNSQNSG